MGDDTSADVQKIKERLFAVGQLDIDESVINELVTSCHPFCNTEEIIELIIGAPEGNNIVCYKNTSASGTHVTESDKNSNESSMQNDEIIENKCLSSTTMLNEAGFSSGTKMENANKDAEKIENNIRNHKAEYSNENMLESSDSESDDDNYYENLYTDDNFDFLEDNNVTDENREAKDLLPRNDLLSRLDPFSVEVHNETTCVFQFTANTLKTYDISSSSESETISTIQAFNFQAVNNSSPQPLAHLNLIGYPSSAHIVHKDNTMKSDRVDEVELLEENNNDPNNNLDSVQLQSESSPEFIDLTTKNLDEGSIVISDRESSPQPSCSKDFNPQPSRIKFALQRETNQILSLLPRFDYDLVFITLNKYRDASNRVECTLREILSSEKPVPEFHKRKSMEDICTITSKKYHSDHHLSHMHKRKGKNKKRTEYTDTEDCILLSENIHTKKKERTNAMDTQSCQTDEKSEDALTDVSKMTSLNSRNSSGSDNLTYHTADEGTADEKTPEKTSMNVESELLLKRAGNDGATSIIPNKTDTAVTNTVTTVAISSTTGAIKNATVTTSGDITNVSSINEEEKPSCSQAKVSNEDISLPENIILMTTEPENKQTSMEPSKTSDITTAKDTECVTQNIFKDDANSPLQKIDIDKMQNTISVKKDMSATSISASGNDAVDTSIPMDVTINCTSSGSLNTVEDAALTTTSQDNKVIFFSGIEASIRAGFLKPPKLIIKSSAQSRISTSKSANIHVPPNLGCAVNNMNSTHSSSANSFITPIIKPAKFVNSVAIKDKVSAVMKADVAVSKNYYWTPNVAKSVTPLCTSITPELNRSYVNSIYKNVEVPGLYKARSKDDIHLYQNKTNMPYLKSSHDYMRPIALHENQYEDSKTVTIEDWKGQDQLTFLSRSEISQDVKMLENTQENMSAINNSTEIIAGPSTTEHVNKKFSSLPVAKRSQEVLNSPVQFALINDTLIEQMKEPGKTKDPDISVLNPAVAKYYYPMLSMFPDVDPTYIKNECNKFISIYYENAHKENEQFNMLIEHLLSTGFEHPRVRSSLKEHAEDEKGYDVKECYLDLLDLFPNADPSYLREKAEMLYDNPEERKIFIQAKIDKPDYPTREEYIAKKQITEQQKQYTTNFSITNFLEICPDPFSQFENRYRQCIFQGEAFEFLSYRFCQFRKDTLHRIYRNNNYNLSLTAKELHEAHPDRKTKRRIPQFLATQNIPLLQEMAFVTHREELMEHMHNLAMEEAKEFRRLKERNELLQCQCCFDSEIVPSKCAYCDEGHIFCYQCIRTGVETKLGDGETHIQCFLDCGNEFSISVLQSVLTPTKFSILLQKRQEAEVMAAGLEGLVSCPFCHFASIPPPEDKVFKCLNPECMKETCRRCKELNHVPLKCEEANAENVRHILEEKMTEALVRKCYKCKRPFFKEEGCNRMTCFCGAVMCYICDKPITHGYDHFSGQGSTRTDLCPLWSDNRRINAQTVAIAAEEAVKELRKANPKVQIDAQSLVPQVPQNSRGPHNDILNSNVIPKRAYSLSKDNR